MRSTRNITPQKKIQSSYCSPIEYVSSILCIINNSTPITLATITAVINQVLLPIFGTEKPHPIHYKEQLDKISLAICASATFLATMTILAFSCKQRKKQIIKPYHIKSISQFSLLYFSLMGTNDHAHLLKPSKLTLFDNHPVLNTVSVIALANIIVLTTIGISLYHPRLRWNRLGLPTLGLSPLLPEHSKCCFTKKTIGIISDGISIFIPALKGYTLLGIVYNTFFQTEHYTWTTLATLIPSSLIWLLSLSFIPLNRTNSLYTKNKPRCLLSATKTFFSLSTFVESLAVNLYLIDYVAVLCQATLYHQKDTTQVISFPSAWIAPIIIALAATYDMKKHLPRFQSSRMAKQPALSLSLGSDA